MSGILKHVSGAFDGASVTDPFLFSAQEGLCRGTPLPLGWAVTCPLLGAEAV